MLLKWCPIFDSLPLIQNSKFNNFLWVCWFLCKNISNFAPPAWKLHNQYCHSAHSMAQCDIIIFEVAFLFLCKPSNQKNVFKTFLFLLKRYDVCKLRTFFHENTSMYIKYESWMFCFRKEFTQLCTYYWGKHFGAKN